MRATVLTSATLTVDGSRSTTSRAGSASARGHGGAPAVGVRLHDARPFCTCRADARSAVAANSPRRRPARSIDILKRTKGRAFVLFTSYATLRAGPRASLTAVLDYPILVQGAAPRSALLRDFRRRRTPCCWRPSSFWQGVDVVGEALSCVIIDKLPFASPADPDHGRPNRGHQQPRRVGVRRVPGAARHPGAAAGTRPPHPSPPGPRRPRDPRSAAADDGYTAGGSWRRCRRRRSRTGWTTSSASSLRADEPGAGADFGPRAVRVN